MARCSLIVDPAREIAATCTWSETTQFKSPVPISEINSPATDANPYLSPDGLTLFFASTRPGGAGGYDIYQSVRSNRDSPFQEVTNLDYLNTKERELGLTATDDGLVFFLNASWEHGAGEADIWTGTRNNTAVFIQARDFRLVENVNTEYDEYDPFISNDGLRLYYVSTFAGNQDLYFAKRSSRTAPFGTPVPLEELNTLYNEDSPSLTADERVIVFSSDRPGGLGGKDVWFATRPDAKSPWGPARPLTSVNSSAADQEVFISRDGCLLLFGSARGGDNLDLFQARF